MSNLDSVQDSMPQGLNGVDLKKKPGPTKQRNDAKWESFRHEVQQFYWEQDNGLKETRDLIETKYGFKASERKWKLKLNEWNFNKYIPARDMASIVMKGEKRLREEGKETEFFHSGRKVTTKRIQHFKKQKLNGANAFRYTGADMLLADVVKTPPNLTYHTPTAEDEDNPSERLLEKAQKETPSIPLSHTPLEQRHAMRGDNLAFLEITFPTEVSSINRDLTQEKHLTDEAGTTLELQSLEDSLDFLEVDGMPDRSSSMTEEDDVFSFQIPIAQELRWLHAERDFLMPVKPAFGIVPARIPRSEVPENRDGASRRSSPFTDIEWVLKSVGHASITSTEMNKVLAAFLRQPLRKSSEVWRKTSHQRICFDKLLERCRAVFKGFSAPEIELKCRYAYLLVENRLEAMAIEVYRDIIKSLWSHHNENERDLVAMLIILHCERGIYMCSPSSSRKETDGLSRLESEISKLRTDQSMGSMIQTIANRGWTRHGFPVPDSFLLKEKHDIDFLASFITMRINIVALRKQIEHDTVRCHRDLQREDQSLDVHSLTLTYLHRIPQSSSFRSTAEHIVATTSQESEKDLDIEARNIEDSDDEDDHHGAWSVSDDTKSKYGITYSCSTITGISYSALFVP